MKLDIYKHGTGQMFQLPSADLARLIRYALPLVWADAAMAVDEKRSEDAEVLVRLGRTGRLLEAWLEGGTETES